MISVNGFSIGDSVRLIDGDGRAHVIKEFEPVEGMDSTFYFVHFNDKAAIGFISDNFTDIIKQTE